MARSRKSKSLELTPQPDPKAPLDAAQFLSVAQGVLTTLTDDLLARADESAAITAGLQARHAHEKAEGLTADGYPVWRRHVVVQIAAAWLLSCVFVRTLEDRGLLARNRLAGPGAPDAERAFAQLAPHLGLREYLLTIFAELDHFPAASRLFDREHNLAWRLAPSPDGAKALVALFRSGGDPERPHFRFGQDSTRFLGDLYQDLSEEVRKRYALLQTPEFVEEYILDRTLEPAIAEFGLQATTIIDPTCGSGHFLLGAFERLFNHWSEAEPGETDERHVDKALRAVHGVDINPYAASIARFRLTLAAIAKLRVERLRDAPELPLNVVVADSLLHNYTRGQAGFGDLLGQDARVWYGDEFELEEGEAAKRTLAQGFAAVVGNPPYITVKDKALRDKYRALYSTAIRNYSLAAPFMQRFFQLAADGGFVGQITANSFMKREFGKNLIEEYLPTVDLHSIVNTSGAFIPGHGTPTVLLFGRNQAPTGEKVDAVLARRGEPSTPEDPAQGLVWSSIRDHGEEDGYEDEYVTVTQVERAKLRQHPWSLEGGGAGELKALIEQHARTTLSEHVRAVGRTNVVGEDDIWIRPFAAWVRVGGGDWIVPFTTGEIVRDWSINVTHHALYPYDQLGNSEPTDDPKVPTLLWPWRTSLANRTVFGKRISDSDRKWWEHLEHYNDRLTGPLSIAFAFVATHNHFVLDRGGKIFKQSAPIIKLPEDATEDDHLALLAYLNSSTACFWMKQVAQVKQMTAHDSVRITEMAQVPREFSATNVGNLPIPDALDRWHGDLIDIARELTELGDRYTATDATSIAPTEAHDVATLEQVVLDGQALHDRLRRKLIAKQEDLDWLLYRALGFVDQEYVEPEELDVGHRTFEVLRRVTTGAEFTIEGDPIPDPAEALAANPVLEQKLAAIRKSDALCVLEQPDFKRRWVGSQGKFNRLAKSYQQEFVDALVDRVLAAIESRWTTPQPRLVAEIERNIPPGQRTLLEYIEEHSDGELGKLFSEQAMPFLAALRFSEPGLEKHAAWQHTWALQRREDAGETIDNIPVPPKYKDKDYRDPAYYRLRGKLDVPKERFISYPYCESDTDPQPLYGWAGWNHAQRAEALLALYNQRREEEDWPAERLTPILAGILELLPWIKQWHDEPDEETGERLGDAYEDWLSEELRLHGLTREDLESWRPPKQAKRGKKKSGKKKTSKKKTSKKKSSTKADEREAPE